jgi:hypothetical protein
MTLRLAIDVLVWLLVWVASWGLYGFMIRRQIDYVKRFPITCVYFLTLSILMTILFRGTLAQVATDFRFTPFIALALAYVLAIALYYLSHTYLKKPERLISMNPHEFFLTLDYRYLTDGYLWGHLCRGSFPHISAHRHQCENIQVSILCRFRSVSHRVSLTNIAGQLRVCL